MNIYELRNKHFEQNPGSHFFDYDTLKFFGEALSRMRVLKNTITITDVSGEKHECYVVSAGCYNLGGIKMGAINYFTSDYITLGLRPYYTSDFENDTDFMEELQKEVDEYGGTLENALSDYIQRCYEDDYTNIETERAKHDFYYFHVVIKQGYYEGFTIDIESNVSIAFDSWEDKKEAQKEITELKQFLIDCAGAGMVTCSPGWCTRYSYYKGTIAAIKEAVKEMREEAKQTPTWAQYNREV